MAPSMASRVGRSMRAWSMGPCRASVATTHAVECVDRALDAVQTGCQGSSTRFARLSFRHHSPLADISSGWEWRLMRAGMGSFWTSPSSSKSTVSWDVTVPCSLLQALAPLRLNSAARASSGALIRNLLCSAVSLSMKACAATVGLALDHFGQHRASVPIQALKRDCTIFAGAQWSARIQTASAWRVELCESVEINE